MKPIIFKITLFSILFGNISFAQSDSSIIELNIFPNPNRGTFYITVVNQDAVRSQLFSMDGKMVKTIYLQKGLNYIDIEAPSGLYLLKVGEESSVQSYKIEIK